MKTFVGFVVFFFAISALSFGQSQDNLQQHFDQLSIKERLNFLKSQAPAALPDDFLIKALIETDESLIENGSTEDQEAKRSAAIWLCQTLASRKAQAAVSPIAKLPIQYKNSLLRGEAWLALAQLGDQPSAASMIRALHSVNSSAIRGKDEEIQASYLVRSLGILRSSDAFTEVLKASFGWYSPESQIKENARKTLSALTSDLGESLIGVLKNSEELATRQNALEVLTSQANATLSAKGASTLLQSLISVQPHTPADVELYGQLQRTSLQLCSQAPTPPADVVPALKYVIEKNFDFEKSQMAIRLLGRIANEDAVTVLIATLKNYNTRQRSQINTSNDLTLARETITALGASKNPLGKAILADVEFAEYTPAVVREAKAALSKIGN